MRPTRLEGARQPLLLNGVVQLLIQHTIGVCFALNGNPDREWRPVFMYVWTVLCSAVIGLAIVGYRRHRLRMRVVALMLAVNGHSREELWDLLTHDIIDYAAFARYYGRLDSAC